MNVGEKDIKKTKICIMKYYGTSLGFFLRQMHAYNATKQVFLSKNKVALKCHQDTGIILCKCS